MRITVKLLHWGVTFSEQVHWLQLCAQIAINSQTTKTFCFVASPCDTLTKTSAQNTPTEMSRQWLTCWQQQFQRWGGGACTVIFSSDPLDRDCLYPSDIWRISFSRVKYLVTKLNLRKRRDGLDCSGEWWEGLIISIGSLEQWQQEMISKPV